MNSHAITFTGHAIEFNFIPISRQNLCCTGAEGHGRIGNCIPDYVQEVSNLCWFNFDNSRPLLHENL